MKTSKILLTMILPIAGILGGCSKKDDPAPSTSSGTTNTTLSVNSPHQTTFNIGGTTVSMVTGTTGINASYGNQYNLSPSPAQSSAIFAYSFEKENSGVDPEYMSFSLGRYNFYIPSDSASFSYFFRPRSIPFSASAQNGVELGYYDRNGESWATDLGSMDQTGSSFVIQEIKAVTLLGEKHVFVKVAFNCNMYNMLGASKVLTNGVAVLDFYTEY